MRCKVHMFFLLLSAIDLLAILQKNMDRAIFVEPFTSSLKVRLSGVTSIENIQITLKRQTHLNSINFYGKIFLVFRNPSKALGLT